MRRWVWFRSVSSAPKSRVRFALGSVCFMVCRCAVTTSRVHGNGDLRVFHFRYGWSCIPCEDGGKGMARRPESSTSRDKESSGSRDFLYPGKAVIGIRVDVGWKEISTFRGKIHLVRSLRERDGEVSIWSKLSTLIGRHCLMCCDALYI